MKNKNSAFIGSIHLTSKYYVKKFKLILGLVSFLLIEFYGISYGYPHDSETCVISKYTHKALKILTFPFKCCIPNCCQNKINREPFRYQMGNHQDTQNESIYQISLFSLPSEILYEITRFLSPHEVMSLMMSSSEFAFLETEDFWKRYNLLHKHRKWNQGILNIEVAFANFWYEKGKIKKAACLGHPQAVEYFTRLKANNKPFSGPQFLYDSYDTYSIQEDIFLLTGEKILPKEYGVSIYPFLQEH